MQCRNRPTSGSTGLRHLAIVVCVDIRKVVGAPGRRGVAVAAAVLTLGLSCGVAVSAGLTGAERDATSAALELRTAGVRSALETPFQRYADTVHDLVAATTLQPAPQLVQAVVGERLAGA